MSEAIKLPLKLIVTQNILFGNKKIVANGKILTSFFGKAIVKQGWERPVSERKL